MGATYSSGKRYGSSAGGAGGGILERAMMCSKVMSVWVPVSTSGDSGAAGNALVRGVLRSTWTTMGSLAVLKASTAWSCVALDKSLPLTCRKHLGWDKIF